MSIKLLAMVAVLVDVAAHGLDAQVQHGRETCAARQWSAPELLNEGQERPFEITNASLAADKRGDIYIVGRGPKIETDTGPYLTVPFVAVVIHPNGTTSRLSRPAFAGEMFAPHIVVTDDDLHVFWGEPDSTASPPAPRSQYEDFVSVVRAIWTSTYRAGWSMPKLVTTSFNTNWFVARGRARFDRSATVSLAFAGISSDRWVIRLIGLHGTPEGVDDIDVGAPALYTALISPATGSLVLGYISNDPSIRADRSSVFTVRSTDGGRSWGAPVRIALSGQQPARDLAIVQTPNGYLHAVWGRTTSANIFGAEVVGYAVSRDSGRSWSPPQYWSAGESFMNLKVAADAQGEIHIVYQGTLGDGIRPSLMYSSRSSRTSWTRPTRIFGDSLSARSPELEPMPSGGVVLLLSELLGMEGKFPRFASAVSYLPNRISCKPVH